MMLSLLLLSPAAAPPLRLQVQCLHGQQWAHVAATAPGAPAALLLLLVEEMGLGRGMLGICPDNLRLIMKSQ
eukprot:1155521-Pelagomonas_calceolata.AAC.1